VTVEHEGIGKSVPLIWEPSDYSVEVPQPPVLKQNIMTKYYYMTNFGQFVLTMNKALKEAGAITGTTKKNSPFIDSDPEASRFNLTADVEWIEKGTKIYILTQDYTSY